MADNGTTNIKLSPVRQNAETVKQCSKDMGDIFDEFGNIMMRATNEDVFKGAAREAFFEKYNSLRAQFASYVERVNDFYELIVSMADVNEATDAKNAKTAEDLNNIANA